ncbi:MAG: UDP-2,3-diacylglucosamine diphosphatase [Fimbriimonadaceae bacterium]|nr:UDP-2,3-diacylglucosamine diphosphatase [Fimbriimonadaceae bacterium]
MPELPPTALVQYRAVFVSDFHLGAASSHVEEITDFLKRLRCEHLYLVGDIMDVYFRSKWNEKHTKVIRTVLDHAAHGCDVHYCPGNHDPFLRQVLGLEFGHFLVDELFVHETLDGRSFMVTHGDLYDASVAKSVILPFIGTWLHEGFTVLNQRINARRAKAQRPPTNFAHALKKMVKRVTQRLTSFEDNITEHAKDNGFDGVVCGHIHAPALRNANNGILYMNCGDWTDHCTFIAEHMDGRVTLEKWADVKASLAEAALATPR